MLDIPPSLRCDISVRNAHVTQGLCGFQAAHCVFLALATRDDFKRHSEVLLLARRASGAVTHTPHDMIPGALARCADDAVCAQIPVATWT